MTNSFPSTRRSTFCYAAYSMFAVLCAVALFLAARSTDGIFSIGIVGAFWIPGIIIVPITTILAVLSLARREPAFTPAVGLLILCLGLIASGAYPTYRLFTQPLHLFQ